MSDLLIPDRKCPLCDMGLGEKQYHLSERACIKDLKEALTQALQVIANDEATIAALKHTSRIGWILVNEMPKQRRLITKAQMNMPPGATLHAELVGEDLVVTAIMKTPEKIQ